MASRADTGSQISLGPDASGGLNVLSLSITAGLLGAFLLEAEIDVGDKPAPTGAQVLAYTVQGGPPLTWAVYVVESTVAVGRCTVYAEGGAGGLRQSVPAGALNGYAAIRPDLLVSAVVSAAGEALDASAARGLRALPAVDRWTVAAGTWRAALTRLCAVGLGGLSWRVLPSGAVWAGAETWPAWQGPAGAQGQPYYMAEPNAQGVAELALEQPDLWPGMTIKPPDDQAAGGVLRVVELVHSVDEGGRFRTRVRVVRSAADAGQGRTRGDLRRMVEGVLPPLGLLAPWPATVVTQDADGLLGLRLDDGGPMLTLHGVPCWVGLPGFVARVPSGTKCAVEFFGGKESLPVVRSFAPSGGVDLVRFDDGNAGVARVGDGVDGGWYAATAPPGGGPCTVVPATAGVPGAFRVTGVVSSGSSKLKA